MKRKIFLIEAVFVLSFIFIAKDANSACINVSKNSTIELIGSIEYQIFPGPPNYEDINTGDSPEGAYILNLVNPICAVGDEGLDGRPYSKIHLVNGTEYELDKIRNVPVKVSVNQLFGSITGHHHAPILGSIVSLSRLDTNYTFNSHDKVNETRRTFVDEDNYVDQYGTPATVVRSFYYVLRHGRGGLAQQFLTPRKRNIGAYSIVSMNRFYGNMTRPIFLHSINTIAPQKFRVHYSYTYGRNNCQGSAIVETTKINGRNYISSIRALNGC